MQKIILAALGVAALTSPGAAADFDGPPCCRERETFLEQPARRVVERERIVERHYYEPAPVVREKVYVEHRYVAPRVFVDVDVDSWREGWRPRRHWRAGPGWHHHRGPWW
jgi:hypothetical protein